MKKAAIDVLLRGSSHLGPDQGGSHRSYGSQRPVEPAVRRRDTVPDRSSLDHQGWEIDGYGNVDRGA